MTSKISPEGNLVQCGIHNPSVLSQSSGELSNRFAVSLELVLVLKKRILVLKFKVQYIFLSIAHNLIHVLKYMVRRRPSYLLPEFQHGFRNRYSNSNPWLKCG